MRPCHTYHSFSCIPLLPCLPQSLQPKASSSQLGLALQPMTRITIIVHPLALPSGFLPAPVTSTLLFERENSIQDLTHVKCIALLSHHFVMHSPGRSQQCMESQDMEHLVPCPSALKVWLMTYFQPCIGKAWPAGTSRSGKRESPTVC